MAPHKTLFLLFAFLLLGVLPTLAQGSKAKHPFQENFNLESCTFSTTGRNPYFVLEPGYQLLLGGKEGKDSVKLIISVLNTTRKIANVETRIVEEYESKGGQLKEISRNYVAICQETGSVYYFGEDVDIYEDPNDHIPGNHAGAWLAEGSNKPGLLMPGTPKPGDRYYQEIAPKVAMDRAEVISTTETYTTPAGTFRNVLKVEETTPLEPGEKSYKLYAPGIGLIKDDNLVLLKHGFLEISTARKAGAGH